MATKKIVTVDPGTSSLGVCVWDQRTFTESQVVGELCEGPVGTLSASFQGKDDWLEDGRRNLGQLINFLQKWNVTQLYIEQMTIYANRMDAANDVLGVASFSGMVAQWCFDKGIRIKSVPVISWKGNMSKELTKKRIIKRFEEAGLEPDNLSRNGHDWDACGIGLWAQNLMGDRKAGN